MTTTDDAQLGLWPDLATARAFLASLVEGLATDDGEAHPFRPDDANLAALARWLVSSSPERGSAGAGRLWRLNVTPYV